MRGIYKLITGHCTDALWQDKGDDTPLAYKIKRSSVIWVIPVCILVIEPLLNPAAQNQATADRNEIGRFLFQKSDALSQICPH